MAILFDFYHSPSNQEIGEETNERYHARVVSSQSVDLDDVAARICERCTLSKGDVIAVINELSAEIETGLLSGKQVNISGIGHFSVSLKAPKDANPKNTHAQSIEIKRIEFRADHQLRKNVMSKAVFERSREKKHSAYISGNEIDSLLIDYFEKHSYITRKGFEDLCHLTRSTAARHLQRLVSEGRLVNTNTSRNPNYEPVKGNYNK